MMLEVRKLGEGSYKAENLLFLSFFFFILPRLDLGTSYMGI